MHPSRGSIKVQLKLTLILHIFVVGKMRNVCNLVEFGSKSRRWRAIEVCKKEKTWHGCMRKSKGEKYLKGDSSLLRNRSG